MKIRTVKRVLLFMLVVGLFTLIWGQQLKNPTVVRKAARDLTPGRSYFLGVNLGQASVHAMVASHLAAGHCWQALKTARDVSKNLLPVIPEFKITRYERPIQLCTRSGRGGGDMQRHWDVNRASVANDILNLRKYAGSLLERKNRRWRLAFQLGEAMGIAEGQAALGEAARAIVRDALVKANRFAVALKLDAVAITRIISALDDRQLMNSIYNRVLALRKKYHDTLR
jgi:hypothetical protein